MMSKLKNIPGWSRKYNATVRTTVRDMPTSVLRVPFKRNVLSVSVLCDKCYKQWSVPFKVIYKWWTLLNSEWWFSNLSRLKGWYYDGSRRLRQDHEIQRGPRDPVAPGSVCVWSVWPRNYDSLRALIIYHTLTLCKLKIHTPKNWRCPPPPPPLPPHNVIFKNISELVTESIICKLTISWYYPYRFLSVSCTSK